jgi:hypothetical protein
MPRAASITCGLTCRKPVEAFMRIGGIASRVSATSDGANPKPSRGKTSAKIASDGTARPMLPVFIATVAQRGERNVASAIGRATATPIRSAAAESSTCTRS